MRCYEIRLFNSSSFEVVCADDQRAIVRASQLAGGAGFEVWRGGCRLYVGG